jgi:adenylate kinase family enzyme
MTTRNPAILLLGPTGSGKTPLGQLIEDRGLWDAKCLHFDFGQQMRDAVQRNLPDRRFSATDIAFLREVLDSGALLEDEHFPLARRILEGFLAERRAGPETCGEKGDSPHLCEAPFGPLRQMGTVPFFPPCVVLNGLPRHVGQAQAVDAIVDVRVVIHLVCSSAVVQSRIRSNVGGDRTARIDDDLEAIARKLAIYAERTAPLVEYYRCRGVRIAALDVTADMTPERMWETLTHAPRERRTELPLRPE